MKKQKLSLHLVRFHLVRADGRKTFVSSHQPNGFLKVTHAGLVKIAESILEMPHWRQFFGRQEGKVVASIQTTSEVLNSSEKIFNAMDLHTQDPEEIDLLAFKPSGSDISKWEAHNRSVEFSQKLFVKFSLTPEFKKAEADYFAAWNVELEEQLKRYTPKMLDWVGEPDQSREDAIEILLRHGRAFRLDDGRIVKSRTSHHQAVSKAFNDWKLANAIVTI